MLTINSEQMDFFLEKEEMAIRIFKKNVTRDVPGLHKKLNIVESSNDLYRSRAVFSKPKIFFFFDSKSYTQTKNSQDNFEEHDGKTLEDGLTYKNHSN